MEDNTVINTTSATMTRPRRMLMYATGVIGVVLLLLWLSGKLNAWIFALAVGGMPDYTRAAANFEATSSIGLVFTLSAWASLPTVAPSKPIARVYRPLVIICFVLATLGLAWATWALIHFR